MINSSAPKSNPQNSPEESPARMVPGWSIHFSGKNIEGEKDIPVEG
jgi:hypothetical protein